MGVPLAVALKSVLEVGFSLVEMKVKTVAVGWCEPIQTEPPWSGKAWRVDEVLKPPQNWTSQYM
jgi:hypothetical protein